MGNPKPLNLVERVPQHNTLLRQTFKSGKTQLVRYQYTDGYFTGPSEDAVIVKECDEAGVIKQSTKNQTFAVRLSELTYVDEVGEEW